MSIRKRYLVVTATIVLVLLLVPFIPLANSSYTFCARSGCGTASKYGSVTYSLIGIGGVYDTRAAYYLGLTWGTPVNEGSIYATQISLHALQLVLTLNTTKINANGGIIATAYVLNTRGTNSSTPVPSNQNLLDWLPYENLGCGSTTANLVGFALISGNYGAANISKATRPLSLAAPIFVDCPANPSPARVVFLPYGDQAVAYFSHPYSNEENGSLFNVVQNITTETCESAATGFECGSAACLCGYWNASSPSYFQPKSSMLKYFDGFEPGVYTLVAEDVWNQTIYASFVVS